MSAPEGPIDQDVPPPERWLGYALNRLAIITRERTYAALRAFDLAPRSLGLLLCVANEPGLSQTAIGRRLGLDRTTVSQLIEDLVKEAWIERKVDQADRRNFQLSLTKQGRTRLLQAVEKAQAVQRDILAALPGDRGQRLVDELSLLLAATEEKNLL